MGEAWHGLVELAVEGRVESIPQEGGPACDVAVDFGVFDGLGFGRKGRWVGGR